MYRIAAYLFIIIVLNACTSQSKLDNVMHLVKNEYVKDMNQTKLTDDSIHHLLKQLDPHTVYLTRKDLEKFLISTTGHFGGVGISLSIQNKLLTVITPIAHSPAKAAGIQSGDVIIKINNHPTLGLSIEQCIALTKGAVGTKLNLTVLRETESKPFLFSIKRAYINTSPVFATLINHDILYISIPTFNNKTVSEVAQVLKKYTYPKGIILDLRYNPGGILNQAIAIVDMFIDKGLIIKQKGRLDKYNISYYASKKTIDSETPLSILINAGSASASEIVSGTLQVYHRATIIGEKSFGKGSVQTLFSLDNNSALKMTIAKYYLPNGRCIDNIGIKPDITVKNRFYASKKKKFISYKKAQKVLKKLSEGSLSPKYIKNSIANETTKDNTFTTKQIQEDKQLLKAIEVIKSSN